MRTNKYFKIGILTLIGITLVAAPAQAQEAVGRGFNPQELLRNALQWVEDLGAIAPIAFILIYIVATVAFLPGSGAYFGCRGSIWHRSRLYLCLCWRNYWATLAFLVGRYLARGWISKKLREIKI